ncbi:MAG: hypothetical protein WDO13_11185 [Verrucomicrobiota bacterium]
MTTPPTPSTFNAPAAAPLFRFASYLPGALASAAIGQESATPMPASVAASSGAAGRPPANRASSSCFITSSCPPASTSRPSCSGP